MRQSLTDMSRDIDCHAMRELSGVMVGIPLNSDRIERLIDRNRKLWS